MTKLIFRIVISATVSLMLVACGSESPSELAPTLTPIPIATESESMPLQDRLTLEQAYEDYRQQWVILDEIWQGLANGEDIACSDSPQIATPPSGSNAIYGELQIIADELRAASQLWETECQNPRSTVPQNIINDGVLMTRTASTALAKVEAFLNTE